MVFRFSLAAVVLLVPLAFGQTAHSQGDHDSGELSLQQAEQFALRNHPRIGSASLMAQAQNEGVSEARAAYYPVATANLTGALANDETTLATGALQTSSLNSRFASGVSIAQLITDFGRTASLVQAARFRYQAANDNVMNARARILLEVRRAYFQVLGADAILEAAQATLKSRQLILRQVNALTQSELRSTLDATFAEVSVSEGQLAVDQAEDSAAASRAQLAAAMGLTTAENYKLDDEPLERTLDKDIEAQVYAALHNRPDLDLLRHDRDAAYALAQSEKKLNYPTVNLIAAGGVIPDHDHTILKNNYEAAGVNVSIPVFNGGLFAARRAEALLQAKAADKNVQDLSLQITQDVRVAWFKTNTAFRRLDVTAGLVEQSRRALHLAQARYDAGLGSIVELNQAQTSEIAAEIDAAGAKYDYLSRRTELDFTLGALR